jgi:vacuolar-type H+-ATPase subunit H
LSVDVKELQELIQEEKSAGERVRKAKEDAQETLTKARQQADAIIHASELDVRLQELRQARKAEFEKKKADVENEYKQKLSAVEESSQRNFDKAVALLTQEALRVTI